MRLQKPPSLEPGRLFVEPFFGFVNVSDTKVSRNPTSGLCRSGDVGLWVGEWDEGISDFYLLRQRSRCVSYKWYSYFSTSGGVLCLLYFKMVLG